MLVFKSGGGEKKEQKLSNLELKNSTAVCNIEQTQCGRGGGRKSVATVSFGLGLNYISTSRRVEKKKGEKIK